MKFRVKISLAIQLVALVVSPVFVTELLSANANSVRQISAEAKETLESPRLSLLSLDIQAGKVAALESFWQEIAKHGAPLVEPTTAAHESLVTFVWRSPADSKVVVLTDFGDYVPHMTLRRLTGTDIWYTSLRLRDDARFLYELAVDDPAYPFVDGDSVRYPSAVQPDPLNPKRYEYAKPHILSLVELQGAPSLQMSTPDATAPHGVVGRFGQLLRSEKLGNERKIFVYKPPRYTDVGEKYPLLIFGASYINQIRLPVILDNLIARHILPPTVAIFIDHPPGVQDEELGCGNAFGDFIAMELLPWVRERVHVTTDPKRVVIGGASAGGHSAACVALQHPEAIGNVIAQSGAFWRGIGHTAKYWGEPARDEGREGFAKLAASHETVAVRYYLTIGLLERGQALSADTVSMVHASRHVRDILKAKGYDVTLRETGGGHDPYNWEASLPDALVAFLGAGARPGIRQP